ncbi:alpha/beta fold hydrolase [Olsenella sp. Marseille-P4559]|uniref:alpha/beta fold hydrolase n=1 Tax=Olsenella sp. Marseille-P4559 TaxID=2364795 RepID=UPI0010320220|nr:alpha/beta hydrolase [Olsenella sp. Marseille-P4559]
MSTEVTLERFTFPSTDGVSTISACAWWPTGMASARAEERPAPRGVVQLVHGMAEHIDRYDAFARFLASHGFLVVGHDQIGHGRSCSPEHWGELPVGSGARALVEDIGVLRGIAQERVAPGTRYVIFGHSMGSFEVRAYVSRHGEGLAGAVVCGTGFLPSAASRAALRITWLEAFFRGADYHSEFVDSMGAGGYGKAIPDARTNLDWLSYNRKNVDDYIADPSCGFMFSVGAYHELAALTAEANSPTCAAGVPRDLPLLYIAGAEDPVGSNGEGVEKAAALARGAGSADVTVKIYPHMRHEILNEAGHEQVFADVLAWIEKRVSRKSAAAAASAPKES